MQKAFDKKKFLSQNSIWGVLILMIVALSIARPAFLTSNNLETLMTAESVKGILAFGVMWAILSKGIDLSIGSVVALVSVVCASLAQQPDAINRVLGEGGQPLPAFAIILIGILMASGMLGRLLRQLA